MKGKASQKVAPGATKIGGASTAATKMKTGAPKTGLASAAVPVKVGTSKIGLPSQIKTGVPKTGHASTAAPVKTGAPKTGLSTAAAPIKAGVPKTGLSTAAAPVKAGVPKTGLSTAAVAVKTGVPKTGLTTTASPIKTGASKLGPPSQMKIGAPKTGLASAAVKTGVAKSAIPTTPSQMKTGLMSTKVGMSKTKPAGTRVTGRSAGSRLTGRSAAGSRTRSIISGAARPAKKVRWGLVATALFCGIIILASAGSAVSIYFFSQRTPENIIGLDIVHPAARECYITDKREQVNTKEFQSQCIFLNARYNKECVNVTCWRVDYQFNETSGEFIHFYDEPAQVFPPFNQTCRRLVTGESPDRCQISDNGQWMCGAQSATLIYSEDSDDRERYTPAVWVDNCGVPDACVAQTHDSLIRKIILHGNGNLKSRQELAAFTECANTESLTPSCDAYKDGRIRVRFLRCNFDFARGGEYCSGNSIRFELCERCIGPFGGGNSAYFDWEWCGSKANYHYSEACWVHCLKPNQNNSGPFQKYDGRLCQPTAKRHFPFNQTSQLPDREPITNREYMCYIGECVQVWTADSTIDQSHCNPTTPSSNI